MPPKKQNSKAYSFRSECPISCALDLFGDKWTLLVLRDLMFFGRHEYKDMLSAGEGISTNILSNRLKHLLNIGMIDVIKHPEIGTRKMYFLTEQGKSLIHIMINIAQWSSKHLNEVVSIPPEQEELLIKNPDLMIELTLSNLSKWEAKNGIES